MRLMATTLLCFILLESYSQIVKEVTALDDITFVEYKKKALQKTQDLGDYIQIISNKETDWQDANRAIELAVNLFINEDAKVEVSNLNRTGKEIFTIRKYLTRMKLLKYTKVEVTWSNIYYVSDLKKGDDGYYYGIVSFEQRFSGFIENKIVYTDYTQKNIEVILRTLPLDSNGQTTMVWDILLGDIAVIITKP